jgi:hypothetical protein
VGRRIRLNGDAVTVVGVAPAALRLWFPPDANVPVDPQLIAPFPFDLKGDRALYYLRTFGRLRGGASAEAAEGQVAALGQRIEAQYTEYAASGRSLFAAPLAGDAVRETRPTLLALLGAVALVLLLASVNVATLILGRDLGRRGQMAVRAAATRGWCARPSWRPCCCGCGPARPGVASLRCWASAPGLERFTRSASTHRCCLHGRRGLVAPLVSGSGLAPWGSTPRCLRRWTRLRRPRPCAACSQPPRSPWARWLVGAGSVAAC